MIDSSSRPSVGIVILNWNGVEDTRRCLTSLKEITYPNINVIVVDNNSSNDELEMVKQSHSGFVDKFIQNNSNIGYAAGNNVGIEYSINNYNDDYVLILNNDVTVSPNFLSTMIRSAENCSADIIGPKIRQLEDPSKLQIAGGFLNKYLGKHIPRGYGEIDKGQYDKPKFVDYISGACMLIHRDVVKTVGLIPTFYFLQWEEMDYCSAARNEGFNVLYEPESIIYHKLNASFERKNKTYEMIIRGYRNRIWFHKRHASRLEKAVLIFTITFFMVPLHTGYYLLVERDVKHLQCFIRGLLLGITNPVGKGDDPDPEFQEAARRAREQSTTI